MVKPDAANDPVKLIKRLAGAAQELSRRFEQKYSEIGGPRFRRGGMLEASLIDGAVNGRSEPMFREQLGHKVAGQFFRTVATGARAPKLTATSTFPTLR